MENFNSFNIVKSIYDEHVKWVEEMKNKLELGYAKQDKVNNVFA